MTRKRTLLAFLGLGLATMVSGCASKPDYSDPALRPTRTDLTTQALSFFEREPDRIRDTGIRVSNHANMVTEGAYKDWCPTYRIGCPSERIVSQRPRRTHVVVDEYRYSRSYIVRNGKRIPLGPGRNSVNP